MDFFNHPEIAYKAITVFMGQLPFEIKAVGRGGSNTVFKATLKKDDYFSCWAVRIGKIGSLDEFVSGLGWQKSLLSFNIPAIAAVQVGQFDWINENGQIVEITCSISPWTHAKDVEKVVSSLNQKQLCLLGCAMAQWSKAMIPMIKAYPSNGAGRLRFGSSQCSDVSWWDYLASNTDWRISCALQNPVWKAEQDIDLFDSIRKNFNSLRPIIEITQVSLFAWDIGDRNTMLDNTGKPVALVDVDEMMVGDPLMAPSLAWASLALQGIPTTHAEVWFKKIIPELGNFIKERILACCGYWLVNLSSKIGTRSSTGLTEHGSVFRARELLISWNNEFDLPH